MIAEHELNLSNCKVNCNEKKHRKHYNSSRIIITQQLNAFTPIDILLHEWVEQTLKKNNNNRTHGVTVDYNKFSSN